MDYPFSAVNLKLANPLSAPLDPLGNLHFEASVDQNGKYSPAPWQWAASAWATPQSYPAYVIDPTPAVLKSIAAPSGSPQAVDPRTLSTDERAAVVLKRIADDTSRPLSPVFDITSTWKDLVFTPNGETRKVLVAMPLDGGDIINLGNAEAQMNENGVGAPGKFVVEGNDTKWAPAPLAAPVAKPDHDPARALLPTEEIMPNAFSGDMVALKATDSAAVIFARIETDLATLKGMLK